MRQYVFFKIDFLQISSNYAINIKLSRIWYIYTNFLFTVNLFIKKKQIFQQCLHIAATKLTTNLIYWQ